jgi:hypothetical protein
MPLFQDFLEQEVLGGATQGCTRALVEQRHTPLGLDFKTVLM